MFHWCIIFSFIFAARCECQAGECSAQYEPGQQRADVMLQTKGLTQRGIVTENEVVSVTNGGVGENAQKFCNAEELSLTEPVENNLDGSGPGPKLVRFPAVKSGVDLILEATGYVPQDSSQNGLKNGFGNINVKTGSKADFKFTFVTSGTTQAVVVPRVSITLYDLDEGKRRKGRGTVESCETTASFLPAFTELAHQRKGGCVKTTTCARGKKNNEPPSPLALDNDHLKRSATMSYEGKSSFTIRYALGAGKGGRNLMFALTAVGACRLTTTTTTEPIPTTQPIANCPVPKAPFKTCQCQQDPACGQSFLEGNKMFFHMGQGIFWAARTKNGDGIQAFHCPYRKPALSVICGIAVKIGKDIFQYVPKFTPGEGNFGNGFPMVLLNGKEIGWAKDVNQRTEGGYAIAVPKSTEDHRMTYDRHEEDGLCIRNNEGTLQVTMAKREGFRPTEYQWKINMFEDAMDTTIVGGKYGQICMDGPESWRLQLKGSGQNDPHGKHYMDQRVPYNESFFGWKQMSDICNNFHHIGLHKCADVVELEKSMKHPVLSNEELCEQTGASWDEAQAACKDVDKVEFRNACLFEACNDGGPKGVPADSAEKGIEMEENLEAAKATADESHANELNFVPNECCPDDPDCSKAIFGKI